MFQSKTPKFDEALEKYFSKLELDEKGPPGAGPVRAGGQERICRISGKKFYITAKDIEFYKKIGVPLPTLSPGESMRNKLAWINLYNLFFNISDKTNQKIISSYPENTKYKIWEHTVWSDSDFVSFAVEYDFNKNFFKQYKEFQLSVPRQNLMQENCFNSKYAHVAKNVKNCYLVFDSLGCEDSQCSGYINDSKNTYHCYAVIESDICYDSFECKKNYQCFFSLFSKNCLNSSFLFDCKDCSNCFLSTNLRYKKYVFKNEQLDKEEYIKQMKQINLGSIQEVKKLKKEFQEIKKKAVHRANHNEKNLNCSGDFIINSKNCFNAFYIENSENQTYVIGAFDSRDCCDAAVCANAELVYNSVPWDEDLYNIKFSGRIDNSKDCEYCDLCRNCTNCFACIGLKNKKFCIFNKQYSEEKYWKLLDEIKTKMLIEKEYGEFFPPEFCPIPYQFTSAAAFQGYDDLAKAEKYGYDTKKIPETIQKTKNEITVDKIPDDIKDISDDILTKVIIDKNGKKFRYTKEELEFHRKYNLALPTEHYSSILARKRIALGPIDFNPKYRNCYKCGEKTQVTFPEDHPDAPLKVYCEKCYNQEVS